MILFRGARISGPLAAAAVPLVDRGNVYATLFRPSARDLASLVGVSEAVDAGDVEEEEQRVQIFSRSRHDLENVEVPLFYGHVPRRKRREKCRRRLEAVGLGHRLEHLPSQLSGGERQGLAIVRALHFEAEMIILDEPTMGLSLKETEKLLRFVDGIRKAGKSAVFIDHNFFHVYAVADRIVVLDRGKVAADFPKEQHSLNELMDIMREIASTGHYESDRSKVAPGDEASYTMHGAVE